MRFPTARRVTAESRSTTKFPGFLKLNRHRRELRRLFEEKRHGVRWLRPRVVGLPVSSPHYRRDFILTLRWVQRHTANVAPPVNHAIAVHEMSQREPGEDRTFMREKTDRKRTRLHSPTVAHNRHPLSTLRRRMQDLPPGSYRVIPPIRPTVAPASESFFKR